MIKQLRPFFNWVLERYGDQELIGAEIGVAKGDNAEWVTRYLKFKEFHFERRKI